MIRYVFLNEQSQFEAVAALEHRIWQTSPAETISTHVQRVIVHTGGCILGAYDAAQLVGFTIGVPTKDAGKMWSHIAGVHPDYQRQGIGYAMKQQQRAWAREHGYRRIHWTFDPLLSPNAHFNLRLLDVQANRYHVNFYGEMTDGINAGLPTDRLEASWVLDDDTPRPQVPRDAQFLLHDRQGRPQVRLVFGEDGYFVEIPWDFAALKAQDPARALDWRMAQREVLLAAFAEGYMARDFVRQNGRCWYVLGK